ncbi:MAG: molybdate ABC transporter substrate-binding protein [Bacteroidota bacterium]
MLAVHLNRRGGTLRRLLLAGLAAALAALPLRAAVADEVNVAVAANFTEAAKEIAVLFEQATGHKAVYSFGSTGQLYTQITQGAPFEVFLAADQERPQKAIDEGLAVPGSRFTYATGRLVLFSTDAGLVTGETTLRDASFTRIAIANPATAPYGAAAVEVMQALGVYDAVSGRIVQGNNIAQTYQFVDTGNAELGFVALSQVAGSDAGSRWVVPETLHRVIAQDAVLLNEGAESDAARSFVTFLKGAEARAVKEKYGYGAGE